MTWRKIDGYQYPYRINEEAQVQKWDGKQWIDIRARISGNRAVVYMRTVEGKQYKAALVRLMDDAFWEGRAKRDGLHITHRNGVKLDCELRNLVAVKPGQAGRKYHGRPHKRPVIRLDLHGNEVIYPSVTDAARNNSLSISAMDRRLYHGVLDPRGYRFELLNQRRKRKEKTA